MAGRSRKKEGTIRVTLDLQPYSVGKVAQALTHAGDTHALTALMTVLAREIGRNHREAPSNGSMESVEENSSDSWV